MSYVTCLLCSAMCLYRHGVSKNITAKDAWNMLEAPLMALIGGTLAISKDLIAGDDKPKSGEDAENESSDGKKGDLTGEQNK